MLDQNTDRMWYVIGAVIVGAAVIFLANGTLPSLFASVTDSFEESAEEAIQVVQHIDGNLFHVDRLVNLGIRGYSVHESKVWATGLSVTSSGQVQGYVWEVNPGETYEITRNEYAGTRFGYGFAKETPKSGTPLYDVDSRFQNELVMTFTVPDDMSHAFLYLTHMLANVEDRTEFTEISIRMVGS